MRRTVSTVTLALTLVAGLVGAGSARVPAPFTAHTYPTEETHHLTAGGTLRVRATRITPHIVRVTSVLTVTVTRPTRVGWVAGACLGGFDEGCIDQGTQRPNAVVVTGRARPQGVLSAFRGRWFT